MWKRYKSNYAHIPGSGIELRSNEEENGGEVLEGGNKETGGHDWNVNKEEIYPSL